MILSCLVNHSQKSETIVASSEGPHFPPLPSLKRPLWCGFSVPFQLGSCKSIFVALLWHPTWMSSFIIILQWGTARFVKGLRSLRVPIVRCHLVYKVYLGLTSSWASSISGFTSTFSRVSLPFPGYQQWDFQYLRVNTYCMHTSMYLVLTNNLSLMTLSNCLGCSFDTSSMFLLYLTSSSSLHLM